MAPRRARPPPTHAVDAYIRVSRAPRRRGERFISPAIQRDHIIEWARLHRIELLQIFEELDQSGARPDRPLLTAAIARIEAGVSDGLVVSEITRFHRSFLDGLLVIERVRNAGGELYSVEDRLDTATDSGREVLRNRLSIAEWQRERIRANWQESRARAVRNRIYTGSTVPVGYRKTRGGRLRPHPVTGAIMTEVFRRRAAGEPIPALCRWLEQQGVRTGAGNPGWRPTSLRFTLGNRVFLGELRCGQHYRDHAHPPLTDPITWELAQHPPRRPLYPRHPAPALFAGVVRCASCGMRISAAPRRVGNRIERYYACTGHYAAGHCPRPAHMAAALLEPCVEDVVFELLRRRRQPPRSALDDAERRLQDAERALCRYRDSARLLDVLGEQRFIDGLTARRERLRSARLAVNDARNRLAAHALPSAVDLEQAWPEMTVLERRRVALTVVDCIFVLPGFRRVGERLMICPAGTAPHDLVQAGDKHTFIRGHRMRRDWIMPRKWTTSDERWSRERLERELRQFLRRRVYWPPRETFLDAGRANLHHQAHLQGGEAAWANYLGLKLRPGDAIRGSWDEPRMRDALALYLHDRQDWPSVKQFQRDGLGGLRQAIFATGGLDRWTAEFDLVCTEWRRGGRGRTWTEQRIRAELAPLCRDNEAFPTQREFRAAGQEPLMKAIYRYGGTERWAREMGVHASPHAWR